MDLRKYNFVSIQPHWAVATQNQGVLPSLCKLGTDPGAHERETTLIRVKSRAYLQMHVLLPIRRGIILNSVEVSLTQGDL